MGFLEGVTANGTLPAVGARGAGSSGVFAVSWAAGIRTRTKPDLSALLVRDALRPAAEANWGGNNGACRQLTVMSGTELDVTESPYGRVATLHLHAPAYG